MPSLADAYQKAKSVLSRYPHVRRPSIHINDVANAICDHLGWQEDSIQFVEPLASPTGKQINGLLLRYNNRATIALAYGLNRCWRRWVACKELAHLLIDESDTYTVEIKNLLSRLLDASEITDGPDLSERFAAIIATEILVPRESYDELEMMIQQRSTHRQIALHYIVPEKVIGFVLSENYQTQTNFTGRNLPRSLISL